MSFKQLLFEMHPRSALSFSMSTTFKNELTKKNLPAPQTSPPAGTNLFWP
jgi:hypothetical protein